MSDTVPEVTVADAAPAAAAPSDPTIVFVFNMKQWYSNISPISKIDLLDIIPHVSVQFGFDHKAQAYVLIITKSRWAEIPEDVKKKFMFISRRIKEELEGPMTTVERDQYESVDLFTAFENAAASQQAAEKAKLETVPEETSS